MLSNGTDILRPRPLEWLFQNCDDTTGIKDHSTWNKLQQNWLNMEIGQYIVRSWNLLILFWVTRKSLNSRKSRSAALSHTKGDSQGVVITKALSLSITYKILSNMLLSNPVPYTDNITADHLCWYWHNRSTADRILCLHHGLERKWELGFGMFSVILWLGLVCLVWYCDWVWYV
jgi:hypothetical protein